MEAIWPSEFPVLKTSRLLLRRVCKEDSKGIYNCYSNPETMKYMGTPLDDPLSVQGIVEDYIMGFDQGYNLVWTLEEKNTGEFLGTAGFEEFSFLDLKAELSFTLLQQHQGKGYMSEALSAIIDYGLHRMKLNRIEAEMLPGNTGAVSLVEKLRFSLEGHLRKSVFFNGQFHDKLFYSILQED